MKLHVLCHIDQAGWVTAKDLAEGLEVTQYTACMALLRATRQRLLKREKNNYGEYCYTITVRGRERRAYLEKNLRN